ncbi:hypothetical protein [Desulfatiferula olefinivorans]
MNSISCFELDSENSELNLPLFSSVAIYPVYLSAVIADYLKYNPDLVELVVHLIIIFVAEWLIRQFVLYQRPGYVCIENNKITLWYFNGFLKIIYYISRYKLIEPLDDEYFRIRIRNRILPLKLKKSRYYQYNEKPNLLEIIKIIRT